MVLWAEGPSAAPPPGDVSVTTKSIMFSVERPIWDEEGSKPRYAMCAGQSQGLPPTSASPGSRQLLCKQGHQTTRRKQYYASSPGPLGSQLASPNPVTGVWGFSVSPT